MVNQLLLANKRHHDQPSHAHFVAKAALACFRDLSAQAVAHEVSQQSLAALDERERALIERSSPQRQLEFAAGRQCAREALTARGSASGPILSGPAREPLWPAGVVGSISHTSGVALAVVASADDASGLGVDVEHIREEWSQDELQLVLRASEAEFAERLTDSQRAFVLTALFASKESLFKCLYPTVRTYFDFLDAATLSLAWRSRLQLEVELALVHPIGPLRAGFRVSGRVIRTGSLVVAGCAIAERSEREA